MPTNEKHLEFAQGVITRMAQNSFLIKGWAVTLIAALFALAAKESNPQFLILAYFPCVLFYLLDSYYLYQERLFRDVYNEIRKPNSTLTNYSLKTEESVLKFICAMFSTTIILFYGIIISTLLIVEHYLVIDPLK
jgi:hypothetical protein